MTIEPVIHVTFGMYADNTLRDALKQAGRRDCVVRLWDDLSLGPIDPPEPAARWAWAREELGLHAHHRHMFADKNNAWNAALAIPGRRVAWVARHMAHEYCGFLEWLRRLGDTPCEIVDLHDVTFDWHMQDGTVEPAEVSSVGHIHPEHIVDNAFWDLARPLSLQERRQYLVLWDKLRAENAPLRVLNGDALVSAPISHYDDLVLADTAENFRKVARIVGSALGWGRNTPKANLYVFHARVNKLVQTGVLEAKGNIAQMRYSEVRRVRKPKTKTAEIR
ncbi:MAG TPA: DUF3658 domain-containing protein [Dongiaceae bacterium]|jgi:hypothetical protein|nr:DUF3658 domain-containing protein [Dongiaceae bacterium]